MAMKGCRTALVIAVLTSLLATLRARGAAFERHNVVIKARKAKRLPASTQGSAE